MMSVDVARTILSHQDGNYLSFAILQIVFPNDAINLIQVIICSKGKNAPLVKDLIILKIKFVYDNIFFLMTHTKVALEHN